METAVITGAGRGLGASVARLFAAEGVHVVGGGRNADALESVAADVREAGGTVTVQRTDVRDEFDLERLMETAARAGGAIDCVVTCATVHHGSGGETPLAGDSYASFDDHVRVNGRGVFAAVREAVPHLADDARVLVPAGTAAREARAGGGSYAVSKALAEAVARQFAAELDRTVGVLDVETTDGTADRDPADVAPMVWWAATEADPATIDGSVTDRQAWRAAR